MEKSFLGGIVTGLLFLSFFVLPAQAGYVTIVNRSKQYHCYLRFYGYFMGVPTEMKTPCAAPGKKEWTHTSLSVGTIVVQCGMDGGSCSNREVSINDYTMSGTWLPHRNFKVTVEDKPGWKEDWIQVLPITEEEP